MDPVLSRFLLLSRRSERAKRRESGTISSHLLPFLFAHSDSPDDETDASKEIHFHSDSLFFPRRMTRFCMPFLAASERFRNYFLFAVFFHRIWNFLAFVEVDQRSVIKDVKKLANLAKLWKISLYGIAQSPLALAHSVFF